MSRRFATTALLAILAWSVLAVPAQGRNGRYCSYRLVTIERHGRVNVARPELIGCYSTFADSISASTGGRVRIPDAMTPERLTQADLDTGATASGLVVIGLEYPLKQYGGTYETYSAETACSGTDVWEVPYVGDANNDRFSSGKGFGGCDHNKKFEHASFGGNVITCTPNCADYGALSDEVSSLRWRP